jgi:hypothetical protein
MDTSAQGHPAHTKGKVTKMTDTVTETEANTKPTFDLSVLDDTDRVLFDKTQAAIAKTNEDLKSLKSMSGDVNEVMDSLKDSDDPDIKAQRERVEKANAAAAAAQEKFGAILKERAQSQIEQNTDKDKVAELQATVDKNLKKIKATQNVLVLEHGDEIKSAFTPLANKSGGGNATGRGAGVSRPRNFTVTVDGKVATLKNNAGAEVSSFSAAAKVTGADTKVIQKGYFDSEGTDPEGWTPGKTVAYDVTVGDKTYKVTATKNRDK